MFQIQKEKAALLVEDETTDGTGSVPHPRQQNGVRGLDTPGRREPFRFCCSTLKHNAVSEKAGL